MENDIEKKKRENELPSTLKAQAQPMGCYTVPEPTEEELARRCAIKELKSEGLIETT